MKKIRKVCSWMMLLTIVLTNSPLIYAEEIQNAIETTQAEEYYNDSVDEAQDAVVGNQNQNNPEQADQTTTREQSQTDGGDAIQQPQVPEETISAEEASLREQYGEPVAESGQEQLYKVDETRFVTYIGSQVKTYKNQDGQEIPVDLDLYSYHANGEHY